MQVGSKLFFLFVFALFCKNGSLAELSDRTRAAVDNLWIQVEKEIPVEKASLQHVIDPPDHVDIGPDPTRENEYRANTWTESKIDNLKFPKNFLYGVATAAPQVEGAVKEDNRGPSVWDSFCHIVPQEESKTCQKMDVATNFRYLYPLDLARVSVMGVKAYSFSISWSRIMPLGLGEISEEGLQYYKDLVDQIISQGMKPVATLFHWDLPLLLEIRYGGFTSDKIVEDFASYAAIMFKELNDRGVRMWFTFNEPQVFCLQRYPLVQPHIHGENQANPSLKWKCAGNLLKAHGKAVEIFRQMKSKGEINSKAKISYKNAGSYNVPWRKHNKEDKEALKRDLAFYLGLFADPIYKGGDYSNLVKAEVPKEWLPELTREDQARIKDSTDFFATDFYASGIVKATEREGGLEKCVGNKNHPAWPGCTDYTTTLPDGQLLGEKSDKTTESWLMNTAGTLRRHLKYIYDQYKSEEIYITEFGWAERNQANKEDLADIRKDDGRERYMFDHLAEMLLAIYKDGIPLRGAFIWVSYKSLLTVNW